MGTSHQPPATSKRAVPRRQKYLLPSSCFLTFCSLLFFGGPTCNHRHAQLRYVRRHTHHIVCWGSLGRLGLYGQAKPVVVVRSGPILPTLRLIGTHCQCQISRTDGRSVVLSCLVHLSSPLYPLQRTPVNVILFVSTLR